jgi:hypothetical protein
MFEEYAQAGLTKRSDKEVAISGLLQRIQANLRTKFVHGTFLCFLSRLLLWRVTKSNDQSSACLGDEKQIIPSWSWLSQDRIQFFPAEDIKIPEDLSSFNSKDQLEVWIFELHNDAKQIGEFWFDSHEIQIKNCVIVGKSRNGKFEDGLWFVLLVMEIGEKRYKRF